MKQLGAKHMRIYSVKDVEFKRYGQVLVGYDFTGLLRVLEETTPKPSHRFVYVASDPKLEQLPVAQALQNRGYGGMPIQIGYCNGANWRLNCLEYHRDSEISVAADDILLLLALQSDLEEYRLDTGKVTAFSVPAGTGIELYATTLHYAPCCAGENMGYRVVNILPRGTNAEKPAGLLCTGEDRLCMGRNKWLIAHAESDEAKQGAFIGLHGTNIDLRNT